MKNLIHHFHAMKKQLNLVRALDEDTGPEDFFLSSSSPHVIIKFMNLISMLHIQFCLPFHSCLCVMV